MNHGPQLSGYPIDYQMLDRARQQRAARKSRNGNRSRSRRSLGLWRRVR